jgi:hypothetical protein
MNAIVPKSLSNRLFIEAHNGQQIIIADYSGLKQQDMIELHKMHADLVTNTGLSFIADFHRTYVTPPFMILAKTLVVRYQHLNLKAGFMGVDKVKDPILKAFALFNKLDFRAFETKEDALRFLIESRLSKLSNLKADHRFLICALSP